MTLHPADGPIEDPFFAAVRRRHPDIDLVLLPPEGPPPDPQPGAANLVRTDLETVRARVAELGVEGEERLELGDLPGTVRATARSLRRTDQISVVDGAVAAAAGHGWDPQRRPGAVELVLGTRDELRLRMSYAATTGVLVLEVSGPDRPVGRDTARDLVRGPR